MSLITKLKSTILPATRRLLLNLRLIYGLFPDLSASKGDPRRAIIPNTDCARAYFVQTDKSFNNVDAAVETLLLVFESLNWSIALPIGYANLRQQQRRKIHEH